MIKYSEGDLVQFPKSESILETLWNKTGKIVKVRDKLNPSYIPSNINITLEILVEGIVYIHYINEDTWLKILFKA